MRLRREREDAGPEWAPSERREPSTRRRVLLPLALFVLTVFSTSVAGGVAFSVTLMSILVSHEMGHYLVARRHGVQASLPHFIPLPPIFMLGTLGAVIGMRTDQATRNQLMDIGAAGPIAGFIVAVPAMVIGIHLSPLTSLELTFLQRYFEPSMLVTFGSMLLSPSEGPMMFFGDSLLSAGLIRLLRPDVREGWDLVAHPVLIGAWAGFLVTAINLLPMGQLDGGHVLYAWDPSRAERRARGVYRVLLALGVVGLAVHGPTMLYGLLGSSIPQGVFDAVRPLYAWFNIAFLIWAMFGRLTGPHHPPVRGEGEPLTPLRRATAIACLVIGVLTFMPSPAWLDGVWLT
ncbi:MAG: site-2 protease family protein [Deltaproteobacteria bacterium]|nr:site-2 protease family protein [Deltaproteobacteria bacterium]